MMPKKIKIYKRKKLSLRSPLEVEEEVLILASQIKKKDSPGKLYKCCADNRSYFHKEETFLITSRQNIDEKYFHWLKSSRTEKYLKCRFPKEEIFTILDNFNRNLHRF